MTEGRCLFQEKTPDPVLRATELNGAKRLFEWVLGGEVEDNRVIPLSNGPKVHIIGQASGQ